MLRIVESFSGLNDGNIEGLEPVTIKFMHIYTAIKKKPYDVLDHRKFDFDHDFTDFAQQISDLEVIYAVYERYLKKKKFGIVILNLEHTVMSRYPVGWISK